jgi:hypothetical protein
MLIDRVKSLTQKQPEQRYTELTEMHPVFLKKAFNKHIASYLGTPVSLSRIMKRTKETKQKSLFFVSNRIAPLLDLKRLPHANNT